MHPTRIRGLKMKKFFLALFVVICLGNSANAQTSCNLEASKFILLVENTEDGVKLTSNKGCAFAELTFSLREGQVQEIDQFGMRSANDKAVKDKSLASFRFTVKKTKDGFAFEGIEGTSWKKLSFTCPVNTSQLIDQNGMIG